MLKRILVICLLGLMPLWTYSFGLTYRVMNASSAMVKFNSTDWLDWGTIIYTGETKENTYYFTPKNMYLTIYNYSWGSFTISTSPSCDRLGFPPLRQPSSAMYQLKGNTVRLSMGTVDIVIKDLPDSTHFHKHIGCTLVASAGSYF